MRTSCRGEDPVPTNVGDFVVQSAISVPDAGVAALEAAFRDRLGLVEKATGFRRLEVWADRTAAGAYVMVSWWVCESDFQAYMKSAAHRQSHARMPRGEHRPRAVSVDRFSVICE